MDEVRCKGCGLLGIRNRQTRTLDEVEPSLREQWRFPDDFRDWHVGPLALLERSPVCSADCPTVADNFVEEIWLARHGSRTVQAFEDSITGILLSDRQCEGFLNYRPGLSPRDHKLMGLPNGGQACHADRKTEGQRPAEGMAISQAMLSVSEIASTYALNKGRVESALRRFREKYPDCCQTVDGRRRSEPKYLYRMADVMPCLNKLLKQRG